MKNILDWRFNRLVTPTLMQVVNASVLVIAVLAGCIMILTGMYQLANGAEGLAAIGILGGLGVALIIPTFSRLFHEIAIVTFRIANVSKEVRDLLTEKIKNGQVRSGMPSSSSPPPIPPPLP